MTSASMMVLYLRCTVVLIQSIYEQALLVAAVRAEGEMEGVAIVAEAA